MDWRGRRTSSNLEDRRRGGGAARAGGIGGVGLIVVLLIGVFFGVDVTPLLQGGGPVATEVPSGPNVIDDETEAFVGTVLAETEDVWGALFRASDLDYAEPRLVLFSGVTSSACGTAQSAMGPFYCPNDRTVYLDTDFFRVMEQQFGAGGEFARAYVIAHEVGHHVQGALGTLADVNARRARMSEADSNAASVRVELQADCYAGIWANAASERLNLTDADIRDALETAAAIGDDALQRASRGVVVPDSFTHGSSEQRQRWFYAGYQSGDPNVCDTFEAARL
jgi:predicted metalloprotease